MESFLINNFQTIWTRIFKITNVVGYDHKNTRIVFEVKGQGHQDLIRIMVFYH